MCVRVCVCDLVRLEVDIPQMKDRGQQSVDAVLLLWSETQDVHGVQQTPEVLPIILPLDSTIPSLHSSTHKSHAPIQRYQQQQTYPRPV